MGDGRTRPAQLRVSVVRTRRPGRLTHTADIAHRMRDATTAHTPPCTRTHQRTLARCPPPAPRTPHITRQLGGTSGEGETGAGPASSPTRHGRKLRTPYPPRDIRLGWELSAHPRRGRQFPSVHSRAHAAASPHESRVPQQTAARVAHTRVRQYNARAAAWLEMEAQTIVPPARPSHQQPERPSCASLASCHSLRQLRRVNSQPPRSATHLRSATAHASGLTQASGKVS